MQRFGIHKFYRGSVALGALALIVGLGVIAGFRATPAHALLDDCTTQTDIFNDYPTQGRIGLQAQIQCSSSGVQISGRACIWETPATYDNWQETYACDPINGGNKITNGRLQTLQIFVDCYQSLGSYRYQARASWVVHFPDGNYYGFNDTSTIRTVPCTSPALTGTGGGK